jgi:hypothetical protein
VVALGFSVAAMLVGCADDAEPPETSYQPCESKGRVDGIAGRAAAPSCETTVGFAQVTLYDALMFERATTQADADGEFSFTADTAGGDEFYILRATKGSFSGASDQPFELSGGRSDFQIVRVGQ